MDLKNSDEWKKYCKSGKKPIDIPVAPNQTYKNEGWKSWGDWLGTRNISNRDKIFRSFKEAKKFIRSLGLRSIADWRKYSKSGLKPNDIPVSPDKTYKNEGWKSWGDWLGTGNIASRDRVYRSFEDAREFVHSLGLKNSDAWKKYCKSRKKPIDIPSNPGLVYKNKGWQSWGDWLGTGHIAFKNMPYRPFEKARSYVRALNLKSESDWRKYCSSGKKPSDIPSNASHAYKNKGWISVGDWLGTSNIASRDLVYRSFKNARDFVHTLELKSWHDWQRYCRSGKNPDDIPANPNQTYENKGWESIGDWLGTGIVANYYKIYLPYEEARAIVHLLKFKGLADWKGYCLSGNRPIDIPSNPNATYKNRGWKSWGDWLGTGNVSNRDKVFRSFKDAREFVKSLKLKSKTDWEIYCKSGKKPTDIPSNASRVYKDKGWISWGNWLGTVKNK